MFRENVNIFVAAILPISTPHGVECGLRGSASAGRRTSAMGTTVAFSTVLRKKDEDISLNLGPQNS